MAGKEKERTLRKNRSGSYTYFEKVELFDVDERGKAGIGKEPDEMDRGKEWNGEQGEEGSESSKNETIQEAKGSDDVG